MRPTFLQSFFDRFHITFDSFYTGSRTLDVTHPLSQSERDRYSQQIDQFYAAFKSCVCEGRSIDPSAVEDLAGGKVFTGLQAWSLAATPETLEAYYGKEPSLEPGTGASSEIDAARPVVNPVVVNISPDQETSPYAPPEPTLSLPSSSDVTTESSLVAGNPAPGGLPAPATKLGRGLVDMIGGTFEAAAFAWGLSVCPVFFFE